MRRIALVVALAVAAAVALAAPVARADDAPAAAPPSVARARDELRELRFEEARRTLEATRHTGTSGPRELAEILALEAEVVAGLGDAAAAEALFRQLLAIEPAAELRPGRAPKVIQPFEAARAFVAAGPPLRVHLERSTDAVVIVVDADRLALVAGARLAFATPGGRPETVVAAGVSGAGRIAVPLPPGARPPIVAAVLDPHGNRLLELPVPAAAAPAGPPPRSDDRASTPTAAVASRPRPGLFRRWYVWGGASLVFGIAGAAFALDHRSTAAELEDLAAHSAGHTFEEYQALDRRQTRDAVLADVGFGLAAATAITAVVVYLGGRDDVVVVPAAPGGGVGAALHAAF